MRALREARGPVRRALRLAATALLLVLMAPGASAQLGHGLPAPPRPLHERLAAADAVAVATVHRVTLGRLEMRDARAILGDPGASFEVKRAPSLRLPFQHGQRVVLLLRGARSPFVLDHEPDEAPLVLRSLAEEEIWIAAVRGLAAAAGRPQALRDLYLSWLDLDSAVLRRAALDALTSPRSGFWPLPPGVLEAQARVAADPARSAAARRAAAQVAALGTEGTEGLLSELETGDRAWDPGVLETALRAGALWGSTATSAVATAALRHPDAEIRQIALVAVELLQGDQLTREISRIASEDPVADLRARAARALERRKSKPQR